MIAALGDLTSGPVLPRLRDRMLESPEGRQILKDRPKVNSKTVDMDKLSLLPENSFGRAYITWLERCGVTPDTREPVRFPSCSNTLKKLFIIYICPQKSRSTILMILSWHTSCSDIANATISTTAFARCPRTLRRNSRSSSLSLRIWVSL